jgi:AcrR family transcriptional regulator
VTTRTVAPMRNSGTHLPTRALPVLRADAARNREQLLRAAREAFTEHGPDVPLTDVARRAGVGTATLYRRFPDREALLCAVVEDRLAACVAISDEIAADPDAWSAFSRIVEQMTLAQVEDRLFRLALSGRVGLTPAVEHGRELLQRTVRDIVTRAQAHGVVRADFHPTDLVLLVVAVAGVADTFPEPQRSAAAARLSGYLLESFRPGGGRLPEPPQISLAEMFTR